MDIYQENILDHHKNPRNWGELDKPDYILKSSNSSCGDLVQIQLKVKDDKIVEVKQKTLGCALSTSSASILSEKLVGMKLTDALKITSDDLLGELGIEVSPSRLKCALLPLDALKQIEK
ncbi:MAG: iron-sulfur cluster assembly scaffold protein [Candidatus Pacebacteria bacterium]|nr:iron-sulfur cluster assembly scaffold protein [Candidatus Paceibacterota bacterium]